MKLERLGPSMTVLHLQNGFNVLFSYEIPVAAWVGHDGYIKSDKFVSRTSADHVTKWLKGNTVQVVPHDEIAKLIEEI